MRLCALFGAAAAAAWLLAGAAALAEEPGAGAPPPPEPGPGPCFDVVTNPSAEPQRPMLLNRCTGESWLLMPHRERRTERLGYHWVPLAMLRPDEAVSAVQPPPAPARHRVRVRQTPPDRNCFSFNRRRFCE